MEYLKLNTPTKKLIVILIVTCLFVACTKDFPSYNLNPDAVTKVEPWLLFSDAQVKTTAMTMEPRTNYCHAFMQYGYSGFWSGTTYSLSDNISSRYWNSFYSEVLKSLQYSLNEMRGKPDLSATYAAARIWKVFTILKLTDFYGDIPYKQAGKALTENVFTPVYDPQKEIYADLITELRASILLLDLNSQTVKGDQFYGGSASQWKKLGNSLLLRIGMRLIKIDPNEAAKLVTEAVKGGVMLSNVDMPVLKHNSAVANGLFFNLQDQHFFLHKTLVDHMKSTGDPRLRIYGAIHDAPRGKVISTDTASYAGWSFKTTDPPMTVRINYSIFHHDDLPFFDFQYAQVEFLLAEAILRGYIPGDADIHYKKGVKSHMQALWQLPTNPTISDAKIGEYLDKNPLVNPQNTSTEASIERVNTEFWVSCFLFDADEAWANWRRTGYPKLIPNPNTINGLGNSPGKIPRK
ncbi:MAG: hypothetical protein JWQ25_1590, partial [Daejeonella sp.]|nr:hypothetical protein [Daejeonella sp.]